MRLRQEPEHQGLEVAPHSHCVRPSLSVEPSHDQLLVRRLSERSRRNFDILTGAGEIGGKIGVFAGAHRAVAGLKRRLATFVSRLHSQSYAGYRTESLNRMNYYSKGEFCTCRGTLDHALADSRQSRKLAVSLKGRGKKQCSDRTTLQGLLCEDKRHSARTSLRPIPGPQCPARDKDVRSRILSTPHNSIGTHPNEQEQADLGDCARRG
jgi:hypothetical protein